MVTAREVEYSQTPHTIPSNQGVLKCCSESMPDMQGARDVGGWNRYDKVTWFLDIAIGSKIWFEEPLLLPPVVPCRFYNLRYVGFAMSVIQSLEYLLLAFWGLLGVFGYLLYFGFGFLLFGFCGWCSACLFLLLLLEFADFLSFSSFFGN
jgi:hypothetical protein